MALLKNIRTRPFALTGNGSGQSVTYAHSQTFRFGLDNLPIAFGSEAYYCAGIELVFTGSWTNNATSGQNALQYPDLWPALFTNASIQGTMIGSPISPTVHTGAWNPWFEFLRCGYRFWDGQFQAVTTSDSSTSRTHRFLIPLMSGPVAKAHHTAPLSLLLKGGEIVLTTAASTVMTGYSTSCAVASGSLRANAILFRESEVRFGPLVEGAFFQQTYAASQESIILGSLGLSTSLAGVEQGAGLLSLSYLGSSAANYSRFGGAAATSAITRWSFPLDDQEQSLDPASKLNELANAMDLRRGMEDTTDETSTFPFPSSDMDPAECAVFPVVVQPQETELSKVPVVETQGATLNVAVSSGSGTHYVLADTVKSPTPAMREQVLQRIVDSGLARSVYGTANLAWAPKLAKKQSAAELDARKLRFLPMALRPAS